MMTDEVWRRAEIESPCIKVCIVHPETRHCLGCFRTIDEIKDWSGLPPGERARILADLPDRKERLKPTRRGGRSRRG